MKAAQLRSYMAGLSRAAGVSSGRKMRTVGDWASVGMKVQEVPKKGGE